MKKERKISSHPIGKRGITLIALVITIIVLLILAGVSINVVFNQGDLFGKANNAVEKWNNKIAEEENLINTIFGELSGEEEKVEITDNVEFSGVPESWTQESITVTISHPNIPEGYEIQYKIGEREWTTGESVVIEQNGIIYGRLYNGTTDDAAAENTKNITIIDKDVPTAPTGIESSATMNSITVTANGGTDSISGVAGYKYSTNGTNWTGTIAAGESYTFEGIKAGTEVTIYAKTVDNAGQTSTTYQEIVNTTGVEENVTLTSSIPEGTWTSGDVTVTLSYGSIPSGYEIQYKVGSGSWTTGTSALVIQNNTTVYGRLYNAIIQDEIAVNNINITNIDKVNPIVTIEMSSSTNSIVKHIDNESGVDIANCKYVYNTTNEYLGINNTIWNNAYTFSANNQEIQILNSENGTYYLHVLSVDKAGNKTEQISAPIIVINTFSFTIDGEAYDAEEDMTWAEWCESEYSHGKFKIIETNFSTHVVTASGSDQNKGVFVSEVMDADSVDDKYIREGFAYTLSRYDYT